MHFLSCQAYPTLLVIAVSPPLDPLRNFIPIVFGIQSHLSLSPFLIDLFLYITQESVDSKGVLVFLELHWSFSCSCVFRSFETLRSSTKDLKSSILGHGFVDLICIRALQIIPPWSID